MVTAPPFVTRRPTGRPPWPITLIAGAEKAGKSYAAAQASASPLVGRTLWVSLGEDDPDEYGSIPGADFEIVEHDGTYRGLLAALIAAAAQPNVDGKPTLIVLDSAGRAWDLLSDMAQIEANERAAAKARKQQRAAPEDDVRIGMDLWNLANQRWQHLLDTLRDHHGPSIVTARLELTAVVDDRGEPTGKKAQKVKAQKGLPFDVGVIVEMPARGETWLAGARSLRLQLPEPRRVKDFTVHRLWESLGLAEADATSPRQHSRVDAEDRPATEAEAARAELRDWAERNGHDLAEIAARWARESDVPLRAATSAAAIRAYLSELQAEHQPATEEATADA